MRFRLTLDVTRTPKAEPDGDPQREGSADALVERAETPPLGFVIAPPPSVAPAYRGGYPAGRTPPGGLRPPPPSVTRPASEERP